MNAAGSQQLDRSQQSDRSQHPDRLVVAITGASGAVYGVALLKALRQTQMETHLIVSNAGMRTLKEELGINSGDLSGLASVVHSTRNIGASIASGSFRTRGMIVAPCSVKSLSEIAYSMTDNLIARAADVTLKERRRLVLLFRETPLHMGHLRAMVQATENGAIVMPPVPAFYSGPQSIDDIVAHTIGRVLDLFDIENSFVRRWPGASQPSL